jgi:hypothetical protein
MQKYHDEGRLIYTRTGMPRYKRYLDEMLGSPVTSVWTDVFPINSQAQERLAYPTQKPELLLDTTRVIPYLILSVADHSAHGLARGGGGEVVRIAMQRRGRDQGRYVPL